MRRERKKVGGGQILSSGEGGLCQHFLSNILWKRRSEGRREVGRISGRGSAGVAPPDLHWATKCTPPFQFFLFLPCLS